jgi:hypothetical protein
MPRRSSLAFSRRNEKAARDEILARAREGDLDTRAQAQTAYRLYLFREAFRASGVGVRERPSMGPLPPGGASEAAVDGLDSMSIEEEAGAMLEAEVAHDISRLRRYYETVHQE